MRILLAFVFIHGNFYTLYDEKKRLPDVLFGQPLLKRNIY